MSASVEGYDPAEEKGGSPNQGKVKNAYEKLIGRGEEEKAEELRQASPVSTQMRIVDESVQEFDPVHDQAYTTSRVRVLETYEALKEADRTEEAEGLREIDTLNSQKRRARELRQELGDEESGYGQGDL